MTIYDLQDIALMVSQGLRERTLAQQSLGAMTPMLRKQNGTEPAEPKKPFHEVVAQNLIEQLEAGTAPWQKPWTAAQGQGFMPVNASTGKRYRGINAMHLLAQDRADPRWLTYKQAADLGAQVRRGERGTMVQYWKFEDNRTKDDQGEWGTAGQPVANTPGKQDEDHERRNAPRVFYATVFNAAQIDGMPELQSTPTGDKHWDSLGRAEEIIRATGAVITHQLGDRAFYRPSTDEIVLPERGQFANPGKYYGTALHELGHWTGHESRLARDLQHPFGSEGYAREELRAEIASLILCNELGIEHDPSQHASYVGNWVKVLKQDPSEIFRAASAAEKIHGFIMAMAPEVQETRDKQKVASAVTEGLPGAVAGGSPESATEGAQSVADAHVLQTVKAQEVEQIPTGEAARRAVPAQDRQQEALQVLQRAMVLANVPPEIAKATLEHAGEQLRGGQTQGVAEPRRPHTNLKMVQTTDQAAPKRSVGNPSL
jgi:antirestriction protein ArdC